MTGYHLSIGYMSAAGGDGREGAWRTLVNFSTVLSTQPDRITDEVLRLEPDWGRSEVLEYAQAYQSGDLSFRVIDEPDDRQIVQLASGGGDARDLKEACRRAFCRLVIEAMHRERIEVNLVVA